MAGNVVPDKAEVVINVRFAPDKDSDTALEEISQLIFSALGDTSSGDTSSGDTSLEGDEIVVLDKAEAAPPRLSDPILKELVDEVKEVRAKLGWTDVSFFSAKNIPALNFGPGNPELAHTSQEEVSGKELMDVYETLKQFIF